MTGFTESHVEEAALEWLSGLGYSVLHGPDIGPDGPKSERVSHDQVLLTGRLREALERLNPRLPEKTLEEVLRKLRQTETPSLIEENRRLHRYLIEGVPVEMTREDGSIGGDFAKLIDFDNADINSTMPYSPLPRRLPWRLQATRRGASAMRSASSRRSGRRSPRAPPVRELLPPSGILRCSRSSAAPSYRPISSTFSKPPD